MRKVLYIMGQLNDEDADWFARAGRRRKVPAGEVLIRQGHAIDSMYILLDGAMAVSLSGIGDVAKLSSGEMIGEMSFIDSRPPSASVRAETDCFVLDLPRDAIMDKLEDDVGFSARFYRAIATFLSDRLRGTVQRLGYHDDKGLDEDTEMEGELDMNILDNIHIAGARFDRMLKKLMGGAAD
ncbi:MAG: cyclic nucleotide-binding domain-containing protein [Alphaproteobacteria bacterium]|nr:cyclic nucleotide-binding domain-containing protein [Alphaproteobacteria bacterium]MBF0128805.1 cyclic nucleotide-binding domain-containing protein [Alphaproteobacteria bacterium]